MDTDHRDEGDSRPVMQVNPGVSVDSGECTAAAAAPRPSAGPCPLGNASHRISPVASSIASVSAPAMAIQ